MPKPSSVTLPDAAIQHMNPVARQHLPEHLQGNFPVVGGENFEGATIGYAVLHGQGGLPAQDLTVGPYIELGNFPGFGTPVAYMDISPSSLTIHFYSDASYAADTTFTFFLIDGYDQVPDIIDVTLVDNGGSASFTESDDIVVDPSGDMVSVNLAGTSFIEGSDIVMTFSFAPSSAGDLLFA